jgi:trimeric autotransporter adhesin
MSKKFIKLKVHKVVKFGLALYFMNFMNFQLTLAQAWAPVGNGITGSDVNTTWALCSFDSVIYAGGWFDTAGGIAINSLSQWNGSSWDSVSANTNGFINAMLVYNGKLYVGGQFYYMGGVAASDIAMWNGTNWMPVGAGLKGGDYGVFAMAEYQGSLYVAGSFDSSGTQAIRYIAKWNDTVWSAIGSPISAIDEDDGIFTLAVYNGQLYMGGDFVLTGGTNMAAWNGTTMSTVDGGTTGYVYSLAVYNGVLYAGGMMTQAGAIQVNCIGIWDGANWSSPDTGIWGENGWAIVSSLAVYNGELYAGGYFDTVNGQPMNCIAKWNGSSWSSVGSGINEGGSIDGMAVYDDALYVGGGFDSAGGVYAKNIARWTDIASIAELSDNNTIRVYPNPANTILSIEMSSTHKGMNYTIFNELGQQVESGKLNSSQYTPINVSTYTSGIYLVNVSDGGRQFSTKFIKD